MLVVEVTDDRQVSAEVVWIKPQGEMRSDRLWSKFPPKLADVGSALLSGLIEVIRITDLGTFFVTGCAAQIDVIPPTLSFLAAAAAN